MSRSQLILGIDPGPTETAWAAVTFTGPRAHFVQGGMVPSSLVDLCSLTVQCAVDCGTIAVETPSGYVFQPARGPTLLATASVAGMVIGLAHAANVPSVQLPAATVRKAICGKGSATDRQVEASLRGHVELPPRKTNAHVRDAIAVAIVGGWQRLFGKGRQ